MTRTVRRGIGAGLIVLAVAAATYALVSAGDADSAAVTAPPPAAGYARVVGEGFTIDMPVGWAQPPVEPAAFDQAAATLRAQNPSLATALEAIRGSLGRGSRLFAIDPADGSSVNLIVIESGGQSLPDLVREAVGKLRTVGVTSPREERVRVGSHDAVRLAFDLPVRGSAGSLTVPETQFYVVASKQLFVLTLFGDNPSLAVVAESLRVT